MHSWNQDNNNLLCLTAEHTEPYVRSILTKINRFLKFETLKVIKDDVIHLRYELWAKENAVEMFKEMDGKVWSHSNLAIPDEKMFTHPVWSTWAQYKTHINESVILGFARWHTWLRTHNTELKMFQGYNR